MRTFFFFLRLSESGHSRVLTSGLKQLIYPFLGFLFPVCQTGTLRLVGFLNAESNVDSCPGDVVPGTAADVIA